MLEAQKRQLLTTEDEKFKNISSNFHSNRIMVVIDVIWSETLLTLFAKV